MAEIFEYLREFNFASVLVRLFLSMLCGGMIGQERGRKRRPAGFRTYILVCLGATLAMLLGQYEYHMVDSAWADITKAIGGRTDVSRFGAQVINGIGFLGAGTIIVTGRQEVRGLTTAAALWASACMGLAVGAGFYECVLFGFFLIFISIRVLPAIESSIIEKARNINIYVEFMSVDDIGKIINRIKAEGTQIAEIEIDRGQKDILRRPSATLFLRLSQKQSHSEVIATLSAIEGVYSIEEL